MCVCGGGGGAMFRMLGGARGEGQNFRCKLMRATASNQCQIITFLTLKTDSIAKLRIE